MNQILFISLVWLAALALDKVLGEPTRWHPLVGFGRLAISIEKRLNRYNTVIIQRLAGVFSWVLIVAPLVGAVVIIDYVISTFSPVFSLLWHIAVLYWAVGWQSLCEHIRPVAAALATGDLGEARLRIGYLVSRDTESLDAQQILTAGLETTLENSSDAVFASLFWYALAGPGGVVLQRLANTLDAMWGYRNSRYQYFGWWAARSDDVCNFVPAQLTALGYSLLSCSRRTWVCWFTQGWSWKSVNAGSVMASGAAALGLSLGGSASYHGAVSNRPALGWGRVPEIKDLDRSINMVNCQLAGWLVAGLVLGLIL
ncbi:adenosylcobinamide-phosphate synthase CbiB [Zhongshania sp.]|uniref:adenosylcobinamide-phosphate synthase CbiB n=1 Tax=Zhongshania sp. TaxID=1971902 RepID=UPI003564AC1D